MRMFQHFRRALLTAAFGLAAVAFAARADEGEVLFWMVNNPTIVDHGTKTTIGDYVAPVSGEKITHARVVAVAEDGASVYLNLAVDTGEDFVVLESSIAEITASYQAGPIWAAYLGEEGSTLAFAMEDYSFRIELGTGTAADWHVLAVSQTVEFGYIADHFAFGSLDLPTYTPWTPGTYAVPEPSGGLLVLIGGALLALRRKRKEVCR